MAATEKLTRNQALVLSALSDARSPMSAYDILDRLRQSGLRSPLQIYRALAPLMDQGLVHRLESLSSYVACAHPHDHGPGCGKPPDVVAFAICDRCGHVDEFSDEAVSGRLTAWAEGRRFRLDKTTVELRGACANCLAA